MSDDKLYAVAILLRQPGTKLELQFKRHASAVEVYKQITQPMENIIQVEDDFGASAHFLAADVICVLLCDIAQALEAQATSAKLTAEVQRKLNAGVRAPLLGGSSMGALNTGRA